MDEKTIIQKSKAWVSKIVVGLGLCPFAHLPFQKDQIRYRVVVEEGLEEQLLEFWNEIEILSQTGKDEISNTIVIFPKGLNDFENYLGFFEIAEQLLLEKNKIESFQLASFHPDYVFENSNFSDASNYTNRSPFPFVHILRTEEVSEAVDSYLDIEEVPLRNIETMKKLGLDRIKAILDKINFDIKKNALEK